MMATNCVFLFLTERCNLSCAHCYVSSSPQLDNIMQLPTVLAAIEVFQDRGITDFRLIGGEPTIHPEFEAICHAILSAGCNLRLVSNGIKMFKDPRLLTLLERTTMCWISTYGTTPAKHETLGGSGCISLARLERWVGDLSGMGYQVGLSILLTPGDRLNIHGTIERLVKVGIRNVRFIPLEPDGRGALMIVPWHDWEQELRAIYDEIAKSTYSGAFDMLAINDPFDLGGRFEHGYDSCLLHRRQMWSVVPGGDVYSCCFNVFASDHRVGHINDPTVGNQIQTWQLPSIERPCRAFNDGYWRQPGPLKVTCPLSSISLSNRFTAGHQSDVSN